MAAGRLRRRILVAVAAVLLGYPLALLAAGPLLEDWIARRVRARLAEALDAEVTVGEVSASLLTGRLALGRLHVERRGVGTAVLDVGRAEARLAPLGLVALDRDVRAARVADVRLELSAAGLRRLPPRRRPPRPLAIRELVLEDVRLVVLPTRLLPRLARGELHLARGRARNVSLRDGLSWVTGLVELTADFALPGGIAVGVGYAGERLTLTGDRLPGGRLSVRFPIPRPGPDGYELGTILEIARSLAGEIGRELLWGEVRRRLEGR